MTRTVEIVREAIGDVEVVLAGNWTVEITEQDGGVTSYAVRIPHTRTLVVEAGETQTITV